MVRFKNTTVFNKFTTIQYIKVNMKESYTQQTKHIILSYLTEPFVVPLTQNNSCVKINNTENCVV